MIKSVSHASVSSLVTDGSMCFATALDKALENNDCMIAILCCQAKNRFYESTQRLIQPRRVRCIRITSSFGLKAEAFVKTGNQNGPSSQYRDSSSQDDQA
jgi:hypothetical protein